MSMQYVREAYGVPAKRGRRVDVYFQRDNPPAWTLAASGRITSATHHLYIDGAGPYHPTHGVVYLDDNGDVLLDTRRLQGIAWRNKSGFS